jgi:hypothetical protein
MEGPLYRLLISSPSINKHGRHRQFLFLIGRFLTPSFGSFGQTVSKEKNLKISQSETRIACGGHVY